MADREEQPRGWRARVAWFVLLWAGGVAAVTALAYALRLVMRWAT